MKVHQIQSSAVKAFVSPRGVAKRCRKCREINHDCGCLKPSPLLTKKERSCVVFAKSWLLNWWLSDNENEESSSSDISDGEIDAEESFVFPERGENDQTEDSIEETEDEVEEEESAEEEEFDPNKAFIEYEFDESNEELPPFSFLVKNLLDQSEQ